MENKKNKFFNNELKFTFKSPMLDEIWPDNVFISGSSLHLTSQFCKFEFRDNPNFKMVLELIQDPLIHDTYYQVTVIGPPRLSSRCSDLSIG